MWVAIGFFSGDVNLAKNLLRWCHQLDGNLSHGALLVCDPGVDWSAASECLRIASSVFQRVEIIAIDESWGSWPAGPNALFRRAAQFMQSRHIGPWLWLEPDACPVRKGWLDTLQAAYFAAGKPFTGSVMQAVELDMPQEYLAGIAVYPMDAWERMSPAWREDKAFDVATASVTVPHAANTPLIQHLWGEKDLPPTFVAEKTAESPRNALTLASIKPETVLFHRNKDGTLLRLLRNRNVVNGEDWDVFAHGGDVGDMIYGMAAMKALGPKPLVLHNHPVRERWTEAKVRAIAPFLEIQPYITGVCYEDKAPKTKWNFNPFREKNWSIRGTILNETLCDTQLGMFDLPKEIKNEPWLQVDQAVQVNGKPIVIHRSPRYHNPKFPWREIRRLYGTSAVFVGMPDEWQAWQRAFGPIEYYPTASYLELARVIAGAVLFIGNQSCPYAIAEGLKQNAILESFYGASDCQFYRPNLINNPDAWKIKLPTISELWEKQISTATL